MFDLNKITYEGEGPIVNEFCLATCTVNGSGSATANQILYRTLFHMGIPTSGKTFSLPISRVCDLVRDSCFSERLYRTIAL